MPSEKTYQSVKKSIYVN